MRTTIQILRYELTLTVLTWALAVMRPINRYAANRILRLANIQSEYRFKRVIAIKEHAGV